MRPFDPAKCGTPRGRDQHRHRGEAVCEPCRQAWNAVSRERQARLREGGWVRPDREPPKLQVISGGTCSKCANPLRRRGTTEPLCAPCRGNLPGYNIPISRELRFAIYERDGWVCQLCDQPVDPSAPPNTRWGATLDHIHPRSKGGDHSAENLRLAHRRCNALRGNRVSPAEYQAAVNALGARLDAALGRL